MTVLSVSFALLPVSADAGGGAEQILWNVERGLVAAGHRSIVVAARGSCVSGRLVVTTPAQGEITEEIRRKAHEEHRSVIESLIESEQPDLIHFHGLDFPAYLPRSGPPMLGTLHLPVDWYPQTIFEAPGLNLNFVSQSQAASNGHVNGCRVICNGVDLSRFRPSAAKNEFALVLSRICPEKGIDIALRVAHRLDMEVIVAGPVHPFAAHQEYFANRIKPLLDDRRRYIGPVGGQQKIDLLAAAKCLLAPSLVAETSSLVGMEAIACGTPVIAFRSGALPEVIQDGVTGFIVHSEDEMAAAVPRVDNISPQQCRQVAIKRFDVQRMIREYFELYESLR